MNVGQSPCNLHEIHAARFGNQKSRENRGDFLYYIINTLIAILSALSSLYYRCAERHQRQFGDFEELLAEGDSYNRAIAEYSDDDIDQGHWNSEKHQPYNIHKQAHRATAVYDVFAERAERKAGEFEALHAYRYPDNCDAPAASGKYPCESANCAAANEP